VYSVFRAIRPERENSVKPRDTMSAVGIAARRNNLRAISGQRSANACAEVAAPAQNHNSHLLFQAGEIN